MDRRQFLASLPAAAAVATGLLAPGAEAGRLPKFDLPPTDATTGEDGAEANQSPLSRPVEETMTLDYQAQKLIEWFEQRFECAYGPESGIDLTYRTFALCTTLKHNEGAWVKLAREMRARFSAVPLGSKFYWRLPDKVQMEVDGGDRLAIVRVRASVDHAAGLPVKAEGEPFEWI